MHPALSRPVAPSLSLILPAWNESEVIVRAIEEADQALREVAACYEIIVVDDGSTDDTAALVQQLAASNPAVRLLRHQPNRGYGAALRSGFAAATMDRVVFTDADCQFDLTELDRFVLLSQRYDVVCGYRIDRKDTALRCFYSKVYNQLVRALLGTGVRDVDCALKMFHREVVQELEITGDGFLVNSEILVQAKQQGRSIVEVGVSHRPRTAGSSTVSVRHIPKVLTDLVRYWWNVVQFPGEASDPADEKPVTAPPVRREHSDSLYGGLQVALLMIAALFLLTNLGYPLIDRDETRYAEIPREMLVTGNWVLPRLNFQTYYDKPPLLYWLCAISFKWFGIGEASARLVPALAALGTIASTMFFGTRFFGRRIGLLSGIVLMLSVGFTFTSRYLLLDGLLALFVSTSLLTAIEAIRGDRFRLSWWLLSGVLCGLGFLTKGPLALVLWLPPVFVFSWLSRSSVKPRLSHYAAIAGVVSAIAAPWLVAVSLQDPTFLAEFFLRHHLARFAGEFHARPIWYFIPVLLIAAHPWSFLTIPYAKFLFGRGDDLRRQRPPAIGFMMLCVGWCFLFFSLSRCKLPTYLLPAAPPLALMMGHYLDLVLRRTADPTRHWFARFWSARSATAATCLAGVGFVVFAVTLGQSISLGVFGWGILWISLLVSTLVLLGDKHQARFAWGSTSAVAFLFAVMVMHHLLPMYSRSQTLFGATSPLGQPLADRSDSQWHSSTAMATIAHEFSEVPFYLGRNDIVNFARVQDAGLQQFVAKNRRCLLVMDQQVSTTELRRYLPPKSQLKGLGQRGSAQLIEVAIAPTIDRIATRAQHTSTTTPLSKHRDAAW
ncbi:glycosyltransferase [Stieleria sp. TO1_6]|uniref:glycosyltransferase n=1 Tax=Stieleria tagensis TaxID=2956795 RepID=UPI00209ADB03|nr:glycosyltransferase [Stieleria tagensis]MCO8121685.1 glycosyltransferase [Stieleria tagensis]